MGSLCFQEYSSYFCGVSKGTALCIICVPDRGSIVCVSLSVFGSCVQSHYGLDLRTGKCSCSTYEAGTGGAPGVLRAQSQLYQIRNASAGPEAHWIQILLSPT